MTVVLRTLFDLSSRFVFVTEIDCVLYEVRVEGERVVFVIEAVCVFFALRADFEKRIEIERDRWQRRVSTFVTYRL